MLRLTIYLIMLLSSLTTRADVPCKYQPYLATMKPDFGCPSPGEDDLIPPHSSLRESIELKVSAPAPWTGILMDSNRVIHLGLRVQALRQLRWLDLKTAEEKRSSERELTKRLSAADLKLLTVERESYKRQSQALQVELDHKNKWYRSWSFGFVVGAAVASATAVTIAVVR